jgi:hypothetical protein
MLVTTDLSQRSMNRLISPDNPVVFRAHDNTEITKQGYWAEQWFARYFKSKGCEVELNSDPYGWWDEKVMPINKNSFYMQVKCLTIYKNFNRIGIKIGPRGDSFEAVQRADYLGVLIRKIDWFKPIDDSAWAGKVLIVKNHRKYPMTWIPEAGENQILIPLLPENFMQIATLTKEELDEVSSFKTGVKYKK